MAQQSEVGTCHQHKAFLTTGEGSVELAFELPLMVLNPVVTLAQTGIVVGVGSLYLTQTLVVDTVEE